MNGSDPQPTPPRRRQGFWLTAGEIVGVLALVIAAANYWDSHQQRIEDARQRVADARQTQAQTLAHAAFVTQGEALPDGRAVTLRPLSPSQAIQSQRYTFPAAILDHSVDTTAERPRVEADWIASGLRKALDAAHAPGSGAARLPILIETTYVEDGESRSDRSLYQLGFAWKRGFLGGRQIRLTGVALAKRGVAGDPSVVLEERWTAGEAALGARGAPPAP